jgi:hypothetical protein
MFFSVFISDCKKIFNIHENLNETYKKGQKIFQNDLIIKNGDNYI